MNRCDMLIWRRSTHKVETTSTFYVVNFLDSEPIGQKLGTPNSIVIILFFFSVGVAPTFYHITAICGR